MFKSNGKFVIQLFLRGRVALCGYDVVGRPFHNKGTVIFKRICKQIGACLSMYANTFTFLILYTELLRKIKIKGIESKKKVFIKRVLHKRPLGYIIGLLHKIRGHQGCHTFNNILFVI